MGGQGSSYGLRGTAREWPKMPKHTKAGPVTVTKADGTVEVRPAYTAKELRAIKARKRPRKKAADVEVGDDAEGSDA